MHPFVHVLFAPLLKPLAYLDPGSGSILIQVLVAALLGAAFLIKVYFGKIKTFFGKLFSRGKQGPQDEE